MYEISTINVGNTEYTLKDTVARSQGGGGGSYVLQCVRTGTTTSDNRTFSSDTGGVIYLYCGASIQVTVVVDSVSINNTNTMCLQNIATSSYSAYAIPFRSTVTIPSGARYVLFQYVQIS